MRFIGGKTLIIPQDLVSEIFCYLTCAGYNEIEI